MNLITGGASQQEKGGMMDERGTRVNKGRKLN